MEKTDLSDAARHVIYFGLLALLITAGIIGYGVFERYHATRELRIENAKVTGTMVSVRTLVNGKVSEFLFEDGDEVKAGDVIARIQVSVTEEAIEQLQNTVDLARANYEELQQGRWVKVPIKRVRAVRTPVTRSVTRPSGGGAANLASLEERANRMRELFDMGAVSAIQRDAAIQAYENARNNSYSSSYTSEEISYETTYIEEVEYVDEFQETPPAILFGAENAVKQAELSLNVALQEAQQTEIIAPVDGTIFYSSEVEKDLIAGDVIAKIGDSKELWLAAEVTEEIFNQVALGKLVSYSIDGRNLTGIVIEKISPDPVEEKISEDAEKVSTDEEKISTEEEKNLPDEKVSTEEKVSTPEEKKVEEVENPATAEFSLTASEKVVSAVAAENPKAEEPPKAEETPKADETPKAEETPATTEPATTTEEVTTPPVSEIQTDDAPPRNDKFILRISLPEERDFECKPNSTTTIKIRV